MGILDKIFQRIWSCQREGQGRPQKVRVVMEDLVGGTEDYSEMLFCGECLRELLKEAFSKFF